MTLDLTKGICETEAYNAWKFPGGEIHFKLKQNKIDEFKRYQDNIRINVRLNDNDNLIFLSIVVDTLRKYFENELELYIPYMLYQQADRDFGLGECFSLKTITNFINSMEFSKVYVFDPHSDVTPALLNNCRVISNFDFILGVLRDMLDTKFIDHSMTDKINNLVIVSPDAGAFKKIFKLCEKMNFKGEIVTCSKSRNHNTGEITTVVPKFDSTKSVLIIDDIALGSRTFFNIRNEISNENVFLAVSHGIFNENVDKLETEFTKVYTTNSRRDESIGKNIKVIKIF